MKRLYIDKEKIIVRLLVNKFHLPELKLRECPDRFACVNVNCPRGNIALVFQHDNENIEIETKN